MNPDTLQVNAENLQTVFSTLGEKAVDFGLKMVAAIVVFSIGMWIANRVTRSFRRGMARRELEPSLQSFLGSFIGILLKIFVVVIVLTTVGVQMTSIVAVLGAASLAVGMALSGTLQNFAGGIVLLLFKPFRVGDTIETGEGKMGVVKKIMIFTTELHTFDNQVVFLPNGALSNGTITNLSDGALRRTDLTVGISYGDSVATARKEILAILKKDKRVLQKTTQAPVVFVASLDDSAVTLTVRFWTKYDDMYATAADVLEVIYETLPKKKVHFPFPQMDVHVIK